MEDWFLWKRPHSGESEAAGVEEVLEIRSKIKPKKKGGVEKRCLTI